MNLFFVLLIILLAAKLGAEICVRIGQPAVLGEILAGVVLGLIAHYGPFAGGPLASLTDDELFHGLVELGAFCLLLAAGVELEAREMVEASKRSTLIAAAGMVVPFLSGCALAVAFFPSTDLLPAQILFMGTALAITAVPVAIKVLMDLGQLESPTGTTVVAAAVADDVLSLLLLAVLTALISTGEAPTAVGLALIAAKSAAFVAIVVVLFRFNSPRVEDLLSRLAIEQGGFTSLLVVAFLLAGLAEALGLHAILGAFAAGLLTSRRAVSKERFEGVKSKVDALAHGFLGPVFFVSIGLHLELGAVMAIPLFVALLVVVAFAGKIVGAGGAALLLGFEPREAWNIGVSMSARGVVELIVASIAAEAGLFAVTGGSAIIENLFSAVVLMAIVTSVAVPPVLRASLRE